jgi:hypothetical protein
MRAEKLRIYFPPNIVGMIKWIRWAEYVEHVGQTGNTQVHTASIIRAMMHYAHLKCGYTSTRLHGTPSQKAVVFEGELGKYFHREWRFHSFSLSPPTSVSAFLLEF